MARAEKRSPYFTVDAHADTPFAWEMARLLERGRKLLMAAPARIIRGGVYLQVYALFTPSGMVECAAVHTLRMMARAIEEAEKGGLARVDSRAALDDLVARGGHGYVFSIEGGEVLGADTLILPVLARLGVRILGPLWSRPNAFGEGIVFGKGHDRGAGLTRLGRELIRRLPEYGILPDVSHMSPRAVRDTLDVARGPVLATHSNAHWLCPVTRNLTKAQVRAIAATGGVIGVNFCPAFLETNPARASIASVIRHIEAIAEIAGPDHVGLGSDFDGISRTPRGLPHLGAIQTVAQALERRRHPREFIAKVMGGNFLRVFRGGWAQ